MLRDICLAVSFGERIGVVGRSGSGKSSLVMALLGFLTVRSGCVRLAKGEDVEYLKQTSRTSAWRRRVCVLLQESAICVSATLREHVDPFQEHSDTEILQALEKVFGGGGGGGGGDK